MACRSHPARQAAGPPAYIPTDISHQCTCQSTETSNAFAFPPTTMFGNNWRTKVAVFARGCAQNSAETRYLCLFFGFFLTDLQVRRERVQTWRVTAHFFAQIPVSCLCYFCLFCSWRLNLEAPFLIHVYKSTGGSRCSKNSQIVNVSDLHFKVKPPEFQCLQLLQNGCIF